MKKPIDSVGKVGYSMTMLNNLLNK